MSKFCTNCGHIVQKDWKICPFCAHDLRNHYKQKAQTTSSSKHYYNVNQEENIVSSNGIDKAKSKKRKKLTKTQKKAIIITSIFVLSGVVTGLSLYFGFNKVRIINYFVDNGSSFRFYTYSLPRSDFDLVINQPHPSHSYNNYDLVIQAIESYCTPNCEELRKIGNDVISQCLNSNDDEEIVNALLSFSQGITYKEESTDLAKYPLETIFDQGDCEDMCIFFGSLVEVAGFDAALILVEIWDDKKSQWIGHVIVGVYLDFMPDEHSGGTSWHYEIGGNEYWICETTSQGWMVGQLPVQDPGDLNVLAYEFID